jgi:hypothetical protein
MCKEMMVILVERVVDKKRIFRKVDGQGGGEAQGVSDFLSFWSFEYMAVPEGTFLIKRRVLT